ncbi:MAG: LLM class flavin-dependent oxidoreductase, partial [Mycobacterium sp.]
MTVRDGVTPRLGIAYVAALPPEGLREAAITAEEAGLDEFWLWEDCFTHGGLTTTAAALAWTHRIPVGIGLLPVPLRNVALAAMELASLHRLFPGRLIAGIGHGVQEWMGQTGARVASPMTLLQEYHDVLRGLLAGQTVTFEGRYVHVEDVTLSFPPAGEVELMLGGRGPKSLAFAAQHGDGTLLDAGQGDAEIARTCALIRQARQTAKAEHLRHNVYALLIAA